MGKREHKVIVNAPTSGRGAACLRPSCLLPGICCVFSILVSVVLGNPTLEERPSLPAIRAKTVVSSKLRLVYFVGVEGTGHHFFEQVFEKMYSAHPELPYAEACTIGRDTYLPHVLESIPRLVSTTELMRSELASLAAQEPTLPAMGTIVTVQQTDPRLRPECPHVGELSFPNAHGPCKAQQYPDLRTIADLSEEEGVDLRFVYLQRSAQNLTLSNVKHRKFHHHLNGHNVPNDSSEEAQFLQYMHAMLTNIAVVQSMLAELGPEFVKCHQYGLMDNVEQANDIAQFISPSEEVANLVSESILSAARPHTDRVEELPYPNAQIMVNRLQQKLDSFESLYCDL